MEGRVGGGERERKEAMENICALQSNKKKREKLFNRFLTRSTGNRNVIDLL